MHAKAWCQNEHFRISSYIPALPPRSPRLPTPPTLCLSCSERFFCRHLLAKIAVVFTSSPTFDGPHTWGVLLECFDGLLETLKLKVL